MTQIANIVLVGGGMANTFVLSRIISALTHAVRLKSLAGESIETEIKITLINADRQFAGGVAYSQTDACFLLNTPIALIEPKREFRVWLEDNLDSILDYITTTAGNVGQVWLQRHSEPLKQGDYAEVSLPRSVYGLFLKHHLWQTCNELKQANQRYGTKIQLEFLQATVEAIHRLKTGFQLSLKDNRAEVMQLIEQGNGDFAFVVQTKRLINQPLWADLISFGIGFINTTYPHLMGEAGYFSSIYAQGIDQIAQFILTRSNFPVNVALLGTKAAALDAIYHIEHHPRLREKVNIQAISSSGQTRQPAILSDRPVAYLPTVLPQRLATLQTAAALVEVVKQELTHGEAMGYTRLDVWRSLGAMGLLKMARQRLPSAEKQKFDRDGQAQLRNVTSFTDADSIEAFNHLKADGILRIISGKIQSVQSSSEHQFCIHTIQESGEVVLNVDVVINCLGPAPLRQSHHPLITNLLEQPLALVNESGMGICVNGDREASPNFFVVGPLTSGGEIRNKNKRGEPEFHLARYTMPYVLEDADAAGTAIVARLINLMQ